MPRIRTTEKCLIREIRPIRVIREHIFFLLAAAARHEETAMKYLVGVLILLTAFAASARIPETDLLAGVVPGPDGKIDVLTVFAHPDDETFYLAGTLLKLKDDPRVRLHIYCLTNGGKDEAARNLRISEAELGRIRVGELAAAGNVLKADTILDQNYPDQGLAGADFAVLRQQILDRMIAVGAEVVITHDTLGISAHPDHATCHRAVVAAFADGPAQRLYYVSMARGRYRANRAVSFFHAEGKPDFATLKVDIRKYKKLKYLALCSHASQKNFSTWNGLAVYEDMMYNHEFFVLGASKQIEGR